ncbi:MAG: hypothetical protein J6A37_05880 [Oscillospiraceae bacterium]|nr:hypothetical protein [Oscillospiraceae bacterium]
MPCWKVGSCWKPEGAFNGFQFFNGARGRKPSEGVQRGTLCPTSAEVGTLWGAGVYPCHNPVLACLNWYCVTTFDKVGLTARP